MDKLKELLKKLLGDQFTDEVENQIDEAAEDLVSTRVDEEVAGLKKKNSELIRQNKRLKQGADNADQLDELQEKIDQIQEEKSKLQKDYEKLEKTSQKEKAQLQEQLHGEQGAVSRFVVDNGLTEMLTKGGVTNGIDLEAAKALILRNNKIDVVSDGDDRKAVVGDKELKDFVTEWLQGDTGKHFMPDSGRTGGGAGGTPIGGQPAAQSSDAPKNPREAVERALAETTE